MASSPTSSSYSSFTSPFELSSSEALSSSNLAALPIAALREKILEKVAENRVTLIIGEPGCGKSSQVPQFLLEANMQPILCTQPRRFAVVTVARMVAMARKCEVGGEIGFHIGHSRVFSARSKIIFKTAGVLLDEMRERGPNALKCKVIILDEVHERSVESDLVLVCVKQFLLKNNGFRLVLMSATADIARYKDYFKDLGRDERVEVLAIPNTNQRNIFQRNVMYLEQVTKLLKFEYDNSDDLSVHYCNGPTPLMAEAGIKTEVHRLIHNLIIHIHKNEPDIEKSILVFLPTYFSLEQQWSLLKPFDRTFKVHILHRSIDIDQALKAMKISKSHRKVILATNIAESSVTIPKVGYVIDSCRSLQVFWDNNRKADSAELVWVSKSQADQRKGRTGRTCDGHVYRLVTGNFFSQFEEYEPPSILRLSLRQQILLLCCAQSKAINEPKVLLQKALDPPNPDVVEDAIDLLVHIRALEKGALRGRYYPTFYGQMLSSFTLSFDASILILKFGEKGLLREGIIIAILMDMQPLPIVRPFGQESLYVVYTSDYFAGDSKQYGKREVQYVANWCAFQFWQCIFKDKYRLEHLKQLLQSDVEDVGISLPKIEEDWCLSHNLLQSSLQQVALSYDEILSSLHRFRPKCLLNFNNAPVSCEPNKFWHSCSRDWEQFGHGGYSSVMPDDEDPLEFDIRTMKCMELPFVPCNHFQATEIAEKLTEVVRELRFQCSEDLSVDKIRNGNENSGGNVIQCKYFISGMCNRGSHCLYAHSLQADKPPCKFFFSLKGCRNGESCYYSHDYVASSASHSEGNLSVPEDDYSYPGLLLRFLPASRDDGSVLLFDDNGFYFSSRISQHVDPSYIITTTSLQCDVTIDPCVHGINIFWGLSHPYQTIISNGGGGSKQHKIPWNDIKCILWFPQFQNGHMEEQNCNLKMFFEYLALRVLANALFEVQIIISMSNIRFSQFQVEKLARESFFFMKESFIYDEESFGQLIDEHTSSSKPVSYVFCWQPPVNVPMRDFAVFNQLLLDLQE